MWPVQHTQQLEARLSQRLQEAAQRRVSHLHQIRERAAIGKEEKDACPPMSPAKTRRGALSLLCSCPLILHHHDSQPALGLLPLLAAPPQQASRQKSANNAHHVCASKCAFELCACRMFASYKH